MHGIITNILLIPVQQMKLQFSFNLESMQYYAFSMANFLVDEEILHVCTLIPRELNDLTNLFILLHGTVTAKILLECLTNALDIQIIS